MRTCLDDAARLSAHQLRIEDVQGAKWLLFSGYCLYGDNLLQRAVDLAAEANVKVALDLASFEIVQKYRDQLKRVLETGGVHICFCNEVEATFQQSTFSFCNLPSTCPHSYQSKVQHTLQPLVTGS